MTTKTLFMAAACVASLVTVVSHAPGSEFTSCTRDDATIIGTPGDEVLEGTSDQDVILGLGGNDRITAGGETFSEYYYDRICGGAGNDVLIGYQDDNPDYAERSAIVVGGPGDDRLLGGIDLKGGPGDD